MTTADHRFRVPILVILIGVWLALPGAAQAQLASFLDAFRVEEVFPGAERLGPIEGTPPAAAAFTGDKLLGYVFLNSDVASSIGYSGKPIHIAVGLSLAGEIVGMKLLKHSEPIVLIGIPEQRIRDSIASLIGYNVLQQARRQAPPVDIISGATVTIVVMGESITRGALKIARSRGLGGLDAAAPAAPPRRGLDAAQTGVRSWEELLGDGSVRRLHLSVGDINAAFEQSGDERAAARPEPGAPQDTFIDLYVAPVGVPVIGRSLLGEPGYARLREELGANGHAIVVMGRGIYSFRGSGYVRGGIFDRIELDQGDTSVRFRDKNYDRLGNLAAAGAPDFPEIGLFRIPPDVAFDVAQPWQLQLLVARSVAALDKAFLTFDLAYDLPEKYLLPAPAAAPAPVAAAAPAPTAAAAAAAEDEDEPPLWQRMWEGSTGGLAITALGLAMLTAIFFFQDALVRHNRLHNWVRLAFLAWTLLWLGWYANAQLSVVNVLTITNALITNFSWDFFLMDPLLFVLWSAVAASLLFWARGAFCGWLCPFGALQEFANRLGKWLKFPQIALPWGLNERLWPFKYVIFLGLFALSLHSLIDAERLAEVEPFKTAIILKFAREWPFVLYAAVLVVASMFVERFFCRYLCPLGAALAIPARIRMFDWLKRHRECGAPCQRCANECPVQAIHPDGHINPNECIYCMHCQSLYWDEHLCPAMIQRRLRRERAQAMSAPPKAAMSAANPALWQGAAVDRSPEV